MFLLKWKKPKQQNIVNIPSCFVINCPLSGHFFSFCTLQLVVACCTGKKRTVKHKDLESPFYVSAHTDVLQLGHNFNSKSKVRGNVRINHLIKHLLSSSCSVTDNTACYSYIHLHVDTLNLVLLFSTICRYWEWWRNQTLGWGNKRTEWIQS